MKQAYIFYLYTPNETSIFHVYVYAKWNKHICSMRTREIKQAHISHLYMANKTSMFYLYTPNETSNISSSVHPKQNKCSVHAK